jgi:hypothetical protein
MPEKPPKTEEKNHKKSAKEQRELSEGFATKPPSGLQQTEAVAKKPKKKQESGASV